MRPGCWGGRASWGWDAISDQRGKRVEARHHGQADAVGRIAEQTLESWRLHLGCCRNRGDARCYGWGSLTRQSLALLGRHHVTPSFTYSAGAPGKFPSCSRAELRPRSWDPCQLASAGRTRGGWIGGRALGKESRAGCKRAPQSRQPHLVGSWEGRQAGVESRVLHGRGDGHSLRPALQRRRSQAFPSGGGYGNMARNTRLGRLAAATTDRFAQSALAWLASPLVIETCSSARPSDKLGSNGRHQTGLPGARPRARETKNTGPPPSSHRHKRP